MSFRDVRDEKLIDIGDISSGTQTNDIKVTLDGEEVTTTDKSATDFEGGPVTVGTTAVEITFSGTPRTIFIQSDHDNTETIYIGKSNVTSAGANAMVRLEAGEAVSISLDDASNAIYAVAGGAGQKVYKLATL